MLGKINCGERDHDEKGAGTMKVLNKKQKVITPSCGHHDDCCACVCVKACRKNDSIVSCNGIGMSKRRTRHYNGDGDNDNTHEYDD